MSASSIMGPTLKVVFLIAGLAAAAAHAIAAPPAKAHPKTAHADLRAARSRTPVRVSAHPVHNAASARKSLASSTHSGSSKTYASARRAPSTRALRRGTRARLVRTRMAAPVREYHVPGMAPALILGPARPGSFSGAGAETAPNALSGAVMSPANPSMAGSGEEPGASGIAQSGIVPSDVLPSAASLSREDEALLTQPRNETELRAALRGSMASLTGQNERLAAEGLTIIENEAELADRIAAGQLVPLPASEALIVNPSLELNHRFSLPWAAAFLADLAHAHLDLFHRPIVVSSAVRTVDYQRHLMRINGNAAPAEGDIVSPHLTGATVDIAKHGMGRQEIDWMRKQLLALEAAGKIDVEEEYKQACFHITVYRSYAPPSAIPQPSAPGSEDPSQPANGQAAPAALPLGE